MWRKATLRIADDMAAVSCAIVPAHPWVYGLGQAAESGNYLSPTNTLGYLAKKLVGSGGQGDVIVFMIAENTHDAFMAGLRSLAAVFPAPAFTQVSRMAQAAVELSTVKMQLPAKVSNALPAAMPLSVPTNRAALNAQRVAKAQIAAAAGSSIAGMQAQIADFVQARSSMLTAISDALETLKGARAEAWVFTHSGDRTTAAVELLKNIPQATAVHTAAMMFTGDSLGVLEKMIDESGRITRP
ncbi:MAG: hypothetical protein QRY16_04470 [Enterobacterales bacterium endosymbiont of Blomia tropicalis]|uniref:hypothetical protein n=1 Tax=Mixta mediterraneensis TaxID=2758443 RepID=UPI0025A6ABB9|nr:hypothetical protein [Mixta mediterraneensis]MDL4913068.1 hypothetical protein [Mixta mediterraneensis]